MDRVWLWYPKFTLKKVTSQFQSSTRKLPIDKSLYEATDLQLKKKTHKPLMISKHIEKHLILDLKV